MITDPTVQAELREIRTALVQAGFVFRRGLLPALTTLELTEAFGRPAALGQGSPVHRLGPTSENEAPPNTYSGNYGLGEFPLHTDLANWYLPPRFVVLRAVVGSNVVKTKVVDSGPSVRAVGESALRRAFMIPRRRVAGRMSILPVLDRADGTFRVRWDEKYLLPISNHAAKCAAALREALSEAPSHEFGLEDGGDTLILDNWRIVHGRSPVPDGARSRLVERTYLSAIWQ